MSVKPPNQPQEIFQAVTTDLRQALGDDLLGLCLFGSAAGGRYVKGQSDLNFLILVADQAGPVTGRLLPFMKKWQKANLAVPLIMTPSYVAASQDVFPIEFLIMQASHLAVWGRDPLEDIKLEPGFLRLQLERELKAKLTALRTRALAGLGARPELISLVREALPAFTALFQAYLQLTQGGFPLAPEDVMRAMAGSGAKVDAFTTLGQVRSGKAGQSAAELLELVERAMVELGHLARLVDKMDHHKRESEQE